MTRRVKPRNRRKNSSPQSDRKRERQLASLAEVARKMTCPVDVAWDNAKHCEELAREAERELELARFAHDLYLKRPNSLSVGGLLAVFIERRTQHVRDLKELAHAFTVAFGEGEHDDTHDHVDAKDMDLDRLHRVLFGKADEVSGEQEIH